MNPQFTSPSNTNQTIIPCKFGMTCLRPECIFAHPSPTAPITASSKKCTKRCNKNLQCTRSDCYFAHSSPALFVQQFYQSHSECEQNVQSEMDECLAAIDAIDGQKTRRNLHEVNDDIEDDVDNQEFIEEADNQELMDAFEDELIAEEIKNAFASN